MRSKWTVWAGVVLLALGTLVYATEVRERKLNNVVRQFGTHYAEVVDLIRELHDDAATGKTATDAVETLIEELAVDHATTKVTVDQLETLIEELATDHATTRTLTEEFISTINELISETRRDQVVYSEDAGNGVGLTDAANAEDAATANDVVIQHKGLRYRTVVESGSIDLSSTTAGGDIITQNTSGAFWVYSNTADAWDAEQAVTAGTQAFSSAIASISTFSMATNTLPPGTDDVAVGCIQVTEGNSGDWTFGTDSIAGETETYYSLEGLPGVETALASFALDASAATFTYGAATIRLGSGARVAASGKANATLVAQSVAASTCMPFMFYILADDTEIAVPLNVDGSYATLALAQAAVRDHNPNPLLPLVGVIYVVNGSSAEFVAGTTNLDASDITVTFTSLGPGSSHVEIGRAQLNQPHQVLQNASPATLAATTAITSGPATLTATTTISSGAGTLTAAKPDAVQ